MKSQWKRLVFAAFISSSIFAMTWLWYKSTENKITFHGNEKPLAYVGKAFEDIQRRPASRLLWQSVFTGEPLYNGEAIRTSAKGEVRIQFAGSDRYLDLEPESLIVIKQAQGEIALDLMEGSLFVNAKSANKQDGNGGLVLNSANGKVDLTGASASLSKSVGSGVGVQVLDGTASLLGKDGSSQSLVTGSMGELGITGLKMNSSKLEIISPVAQKPIFMDPDDIQPVIFKWKGFPPQTIVTLYIGPTRKEMNESGRTTLANINELNAKLPIGRHFWKLTASDLHGKAIEESSVYRTEILARLGPTVISPLADALILSPNALQDVNFKWQKGEETRQVTVMVWSDNLMKKQITSQTFQKDEGFVLPALKEGTYYWRMSSYFSDSNKIFNGKLQKFSIRKKARDPVILTWGMSPEKQYFVEKPILDMSWLANHAEEIAKYRVKYQEEGAAPEAFKTVEVDVKALNTPVDKPGRYIASIEALDKDGEVMGQPLQKAIALVPLPLLPAPKFFPENGVLQATNEGRVELKWQNINGAKKYEMTIMSDGKDLKKTTYVKNSTSLKGLPPGEHELHIYAVDEYGRSSEKPEIRKLNVPDVSNLKAPTLKKVQVN